MYNDGEVSKRSLQNLSTSAMWRAMARVMGNQYDAEKNPNGVYIPEFKYALIKCQSQLLKFRHKELEEFVNKKCTLVQRNFTYGDGPAGSAFMKKELCSFYNERFGPLKGVLPKHLTVQAGCGALIDHLSFCICEENEAILVGRPFYGGFPPDLVNRAKVKPIFVSLAGTDPFSTSSVARYEEALLTARKQGITARGLILCNPHNPLGRCYSRETIIEFMRFCQKYRLHLISDEIYALSVFHNEEIPDAVPFISIMSIDTTDIIEPHLVHCIHGMSKDFCANGLRLGVLISQNNQTMHDAMAVISMFSWPSSAAEQIWATILQHPDFLSSFLKENVKRMERQYAVCTSILKDNKIPYYPSYAGHFIWLNLSSFLPKGDFTTLEKEHQLTNQMLNCGVYLATGDAFGAEEHGWFRVTFTVDEELLRLGLKRLIYALQGNGTQPSPQDLPEVDLAEAMCGMCC